MSNRLVYSEGYDFAVAGLDKLHPFDAKKFSKAWNILNDEIPDLVEYHLSPKELAADELLKLIHTSEYLKSLSQSTVIAKVVGLGLLRFFPSGILARSLLDPLRLATSGTLLATQYAVKNQAIVMNFGGGYHHAFSNRGEGFCFFADVALAIKSSRISGLLQQNDNVGMIDLDAHRGNGFESFFIDDSSVSIFDMYNFQVYPGRHPGDVDDYPYMVPLQSGMSGESYLRVLREELPAFLETLKDAKLVFYNAGTDVLAGDRLGRLNLSFQHVVERDRYVLQQLKALAVPVVVLTSGGYTSESYKLVAECAKILVNM